MFKLNNQPIGLDQPFTTEDGTQYPANWIRLASPEERAAIGITEVADPEVYDDRFYWGINNPKQLEDIYTFPEGSDVSVRESTGLKSNWSAQIKETTNKLLAATDWMVIRKVERDVAIPANTVTYRAAVLSECDRLLAAIEAAADVDALAAVVGSQNWPEA